MTQNEFTTILNGNHIVVAKFGAEWCGPCKALAPVIEEIAESYNGRAYVIDIDVEDSPEVSTSYRIRNVPTILYFKDGELKNKTVGTVSKDSIIEKIETL